MKKYLIGGLIGAMIATAATASAAEIKSMIGKKVEGVRKIEVNGKELSKDVIIIEGMSYAPVRVIAEAAGFEIGVTDKMVSLNGKVDAETMTSEQMKEVIRVESEIGQIKNKLSLDESLLSQAEGMLKAQNHRISQFDLMLPSDSVAQPEVDFEARRADLVTQLNELTAKRDALITVVTQDKADINRLETELAVLLQ